MTVQDITFDSDGFTLAGTYLAADNPVAAALLIAGSGKTDRDSTVRLPLHQMLRGEITKAVAQALGADTVSTLRYDKRGVGASGGDFYRVGMPQRMTDARAGLGWLSGRATGLPLLAVGHSEGTYYAAALAAEGAVAGAVLLSGSVRRGEEVQAWQAEQLASRLPGSARLILRLMRTDAASAARKNFERIAASTGDVMRIQGQRVNARWVRDFAAYDPAPVLARVTVPVLAITGGHDLQVPPTDIDAMRELVKGAFDGHVLGDLSHMLRADPDFIGPRGYRQAGREPVSPQLLKLITAWVSRHWGAGASHGIDTAPAGTETPEETAAS